MCEKKYEKTKKLMNQLYTWKYLFDFEKWVYGNKQDRRDLEEFFDFLDEIILVEYQEDYLVTMNIGTKFYRARVIEFDDYKKIEKGIGYDADRLRGYNWEESKEPPDGSNKEQRNSKKGEIALYVADDEVTACAEVKSEVRQYISLAEFELSENVQVLDFSKMQFTKPFHPYDNTYEVNIREILSKLEFYFSRPVYNFEEYKFSQQIVKHFREKGVKGFKYRSFYSSGSNYTFFDDPIKKFLWNDSRVLINYATANLFISLDKSNTIDLSNINKIEKDISSDVREQMLAETKKKWKPL